MTIRGQWTLGKSIGEGGQATAYLARRRGSMLFRPYDFVLKELKPELRDSKGLGRFRQEVEALQSLAHRNILKIEDFDLSSELPFYVCRYYKSGNLASLVRRCSLALLDALMTFRQVCEAIECAHQRSIVHRDIKPENVLISDDGRTPIVADFGICHLQDGGVDLTETREVVGSRNYRAPEATYGHSDEVRPTLDIYSLGKVLYFIFAGDIFEREAHRDPHWDLTRRKRGDEFHAINRLFDKTIAEDPSKRFQSVAELLKELNWVIEGATREGNLIHPKVAQRCIFCRVGKYQIPSEEFDTRGRGEQKAREIFGRAWRLDERSILASHDWKVMRCDYCGNVQVIWPTAYDNDTSIKRRWYQDEGT